MSIDGEFQTIRGQKLS